MSWVHAIECALFLSGVINTGYGIYRADDNDHGLASIHFVACAISFALWFGLINRG